MGWIRTTPAGTYRASYRDPAGKTRSKVFRRKGDAKKYLDRISVSQQDGSHKDPAKGRTKLNDF